MLKTAGLAMLLLATSCASARDPMLLDLMRRLERRLTALEQAEAQRAARVPGATTRRASSLRRKSCKSLPSPFRMPALLSCREPGIHHQLNNPRGWQTRSIAFFGRSRRLVTCMNGE